MLRFLLELYKRSGHRPELALPFLASSMTTCAIIQKIDCSEEPYTSYWKTWGGTYNNPDSDVLSVFLNAYLELVSTFLELEGIPRTILRQGTFVLINPGDKYAWQYPRYQTEISVLEGYSTSVPDPSNPSNDKYNGKRYPARFSIPSIQNKLSDIIRGTALQNSTFSVTVINNDGSFDLNEERSFFNTPVYILKSDIENPSYSDFSIVRRGFVDDPIIGPEEATFKCATIYRSFTAPACRPITAVDFPNAGDKIGAAIPIAWGTVYVAPIPVDTGVYLTIDPEYLSTVDAIYDSDGVEIIDYSVVDGLIYMEDVDQVPAEAKVTGSFDNKIGSIITSEIEKKGYLLYSSGGWDTTETDSYIASSPEIDLLITSGSLKETISKCLESDSAFLIEKSGGKLTLRKWGETYTTHNFQAWQLTQQPTKEYIENKYYASSVRVFYRNSPAREDAEKLLVLDDSNERFATEQYRKSETKEFETNLISKTDAQDLASLLAGRFSIRAEVFTLAFGFDLSGISILDTVNIDITFNGREYSSTTSWLVLEIDLGQDVLTVQAK